MNLIVGLTAWFLGLFLGVEMFFIPDYINFLYFLVVMTLLLSGSRLIDNKE